MKHWTIRQKLVCSYVLVLLLMALMSGLAFISLTTIGDEAKDLKKDSLPGLEYSGEMLSNWLADYAAVANNILSVDKAQIEHTDAVMRVTRERLRKAIAGYEATISLPQDRQNFEAAKDLLASYMTVADRVLELSKAQQKKAATDMMLAEVTPYSSKLFIRLTEIVAFNQSNADRSSQTIAEEVVKTITGIVACLAVAMLVVIICGRLLSRAITAPLEELLAAVKVISKGDFSQRVDTERRDEFGALAKGFDDMTDELANLVEQVQKSGIHVNTSVTEISATAREQQATASEVAATTSEIGATSKEISATSRELVKTMTEVSAVAEQTATLAGSGQSGLLRMEGTMQKVMEAAGLINAKLAVLSEKAGNINQVITTITKVADQTNLLSLNAAIEAEKAGEYGRGFAVVATEIRRLADQTAVATYDIEQMVREIQSAVSAGVMGMDRFSEQVRHGMQEVQQAGEQLSQIIQQVQTLAPRFEAVNEGMQAQSTGAEQISEALIQLGEASQQTVESLRQSTGTIDELNRVVNTLRSSVSRFKLRA